MKDRSPNRPFDAPAEVSEVKKRALSEETRVLPLPEASDEMLIAQLQDTLRPTPEVAQRLRESVSNLAARVEQENPVLSRADAIRVWATHTLTMRLIEPQFAITMPAAAQHYQPSAEERKKAFRQISSLNRYAMQNKELEAAKQQADDEVKRNVVRATEISQVLLRRQPGYHNLAAFMTPPRNQRQERPLTRQERQQREIRNEATVKESYGLADVSGARIDLQRLAHIMAARRLIHERNQQLDNATVPEKTGKEQTAYDRLHSHLLKGILDEIRTRPNMGDTQAVIYDGATMYVRKAGKAELQNATELMNHCIDMLSDKYAENDIFSGYSRFVYRNVIRDLANANYRLTSRPKDVRQYLDEKVAQIRPEYGYEGLAQLTGLDIIESQEKLVRAFAYALRDQEEHINFHDSPARPQVVYKTAEAQFRQQERQRIGEIIVDQRSPAEKTVQRLILQQPLPRDMPANPSAKVDFQIYFKTPDFEGMAPKIPGFDLVGIAGDIYSFTRAEHDPYKLCEIVLPAAGVKQSAAQYQELGLTQPADAIQKDNLMMHELVSILHRYGKYEFAAGNETEETVITSWEDFALMVRNGRLHVQCTGAGGFLKKSLSEVYGREVGEIVTGYRTTDSPVITGARHAQLRVVGEDHREYILDATPSMNFRGLARQAIRGLLQRSPQAELRPLKRPAVDQPVQPKVEAPVAAEVEKLRPELYATAIKEVATLHSDLRQWVSGLMGIGPARPGRDEFAKTVLGLPEGDPIKRVVRTLSYSAASIEDPATDLEALRQRCQQDGEYLESYAENFAKLHSSQLSRLKLEPYDTAALKTLQRYISGLERATASIIQANQA